MIHYLPGKDTLATRKADKTHDERLWEKKTFSHDIENVNYTCGPVCNVHKCRRTEVSRVASHSDRQTHTHNSFI